jgi:molybdopterin converting factor subunit 1
MKIDILAFGIAKEILDSGSITVEFDHQATVGDIRSFLEKKYPFLNELGSYMIALNREYARDEEARVNENDEVAIIPPVSGG